MKEIIDWFLGWTNKLGASIGISGFAIRLIILGLFVALIIMIIAIAVRHKKKKKLKKQKAEAKPEETPPVNEVVATTEDEPVKEEKVEVKPEPEKPVETIEVKPKTAPKKVEKKEVKKLLGKWVVEHKSADEYIAVLLASNGEVMLTSETYTTPAGANGGIATIIKGVESDAFTIYQDKKGNYYYKLKNANNRLLCVGEIYTTKDQCQKAVESVKRIASSSPISSDINEGSKYVDYTPVDISTYDGKGAKGKWKIEKTDGGKYLVKLFASNGQLMLATEEVATKKTAEKAIDSVKKNAIDGNFIIDKDKFGRFYYKLRNAQKSVICIGESYERVDSCISALESVRRFAYTAPTDNIN